MVPGPESDSVSNQLNRWRWRPTVSDLKTPGAGVEPDSPSKSAVFRQDYH